MMGIEELRNYWDKYSISKNISIISVMTMCFIILIGCWEGPEKRFELLCKKGDSAFSHKAYAEALSAWEKALLIHNDSEKVLINIGKAHLLLFNLEAASDAFQKVIKLNPNAWDTRLELSKIKLLQGNIPAVLKNWEILIDAIPTNPAVHVLHGDVMILESNYTDAEADYKQALSLDPNFQPAHIKLAICYLVDNKISEAEQIFQTVLSMKPPSVENIHLMSIYYKLKKDMESAERLLIKAIDLNPENIGSYKQLSELYYNFKEYDKAYHVLTRLSEKIPENPAIKKLMVEILISQQKMDEASQVLASFSTEKSDDLELDLLKGEYHLINNEPSIAISYFKAALNGEPDLLLGHYYLGIAYLAGGQNQLARQSLSKALAIDHFFSEAELALADSYYKNEELDLSLEHALRVQKKQPENFRSYLIIGNIMLAQKHYEEALKNFNIANQINPESIMPIYYVGLTEEMMGNTTKASKIYKTLLIEYPALADVALRYVNILIQQGKADEARQFFKDNTKTTNQNGYTYHILGILDSSQGLYDEAKVNFNKAIETNPTLLSSYLALHNIYKREGDLDNQIKTLESCIQHVSDTPDVNNQLLQLYIKKNAYNKAIAMLETSLNHNPDQPILMNNLAWLYIEKDHNLNKAFNLARTAYAKMPNDAGIADTLGWVYYKKGIYSQATWYLKEAHSLKPDNSLVLYHLGTALYANNEWESAAINLKKAIALNLEDSLRINAEELLDQMEIEESKN